MTNPKSTNPTATDSPTGNPDGAAPVHNITSSQTRHEVVIVGAGMAGVASAIKLRQAGITDFVMLEAGPDVGGTWRTNNYPGLTVDTPSLMYSFSFAQKPDWSSLWAPGPEVLGYVRDLVNKYHVRGHARFNQEVTAATWQPEQNQWVTTTSDGNTYRSRFLISATGILASKPKWPDIPGIDDYAGLKVHTSNWPKDIDLTGRRVAIIGTGSTAVQIAPEIAKEVAHLDVYQRTPTWLLPKPQATFSARQKRLFARVPGFQRLLRLGTIGLINGILMTILNNYKRFGWLGKLIELRCKRLLHSQIQDPELRAKLTPSYAFGCKRPTMSEEFYPMFNKPHVELITDPIAKITPSGIATDDGTEHPADVLVCATGFQPFARSALPTYPVYGRDGAELQDYWEDNRYQAYRGIAVTGWPNYFLVMGPYSLISPSYLAAMEIAIRQIVRCITECQTQSMGSVEVRPEAQDAEFQYILRNQKKNSIFACTDCEKSRTYFINRHGDYPMVRPGTLHGDWYRSRRPDLAAYQFSPDNSPVADQAPSNA